MSLLVRDNRIITMTLRDGAPTAGSLNVLTMTQSGSYFTEALDIGTFTEAIAFLITASHGGTNPTLDVKFQVSPDKINWADLGDSFTQVTTTDTTNTKKLTANFGKYIRALLAIGGTANPTYKVTLQLAVKG